MNPKCTSTETFYYFKWCVKSLLTLYPFTFPIFKYRLFLVSVAVITFFLHHLWFINLIEKESLLCVTRFSSLCCSFVMLQEFFFYHFICVSEISFSLSLRRWPLISVLQVLSFAKESFSPFNFWRIFLPEVQLMPGSNCFSALENVLLCSGMHSFRWEIHCCSNWCFSIGTVSFLFCCFQDLFSLSFAFRIN